MKEYSKFTYNIGVNGESVTIRSDDFNEITSEVSNVKDFILESSNDTKNRNDILLISAEQEKPLPEGISRPKVCQKCGRGEKLVFIQGISRKDSKPWYAFDCKYSDCGERNFVNKVVK